MKDFRKEVLAFLALLFLAQSIEAYVVTGAMFHRSKQETPTNIYGVSGSNIHDTLLDRAHPSRSTNRSLINHAKPARELGFTYQSMENKFSLPESAMSKSIKQVSFDDHRSARKMRSIPRTLGDVPMPSDRLSKDTHPKDSESVARKLSENRKLIYDAMPDGKTIDVNFETDEIKDALLFIEFKMSEINTLMTECINQQYEANLMAQSKDVKNLCVGLTFQILFYNYKEGMGKIKDILLELLKIKLQTLKEDYQDETNFFLDILENLIDKDYSILPSLEIARKASKYYVSPRYYERLVELAMPEINAFDSIHKRLKTARNQIQAVLDQKQKEEKSFLNDLKQHAEDLKMVNVDELDPSHQEEFSENSSYDDPNAESSDFYSDDSSSQVLPPEYVANSSDDDDKESTEINNNFDTSEDESDKNDIEEHNNPDSGYEDMNRRMQVIRQRHWDPLSYNSHRRQPLVQSNQRMNSVSFSDIRLQSGNRMTQQNRQTNANAGRPYAENRNSLSYDGSVNGPLALNHQYVL
jgi:hypothetical protein